MKDALRQTLFTLTQLDGAPGFEQPVVRYLAEQFRETGARVQVDSMGNLYATLGDEENRPHLMIAAHSDEIGAVVRHVDARGFLRIDPLGGLIAANLVAQRVRVGEHLGVVGVRPGHLQSGDESRQAPLIHDLYVDVGARTAEEVARMGIRIGSPVTYATSPSSFSNGDRVTGKAIDNRLGCTVLLQLFRELRSHRLSGYLTGLIAVQEEVGFRGATVGAYRAHPDYAIVVDTFPVGDTPDLPQGRMPGALGKGPALVITASSARSGRGQTIHPRLQTWLEGAAQRATITTQRVTSVGVAVSDASVIHLNRDGVPTGVLGLPRRYSHSPVCTFDLNDSVMAVKLLRQFVDEMSTHDDLAFI